MKHFYFVFGFAILSCLCGHLLGKGCLLGSPVCDVFLCFVTFPYGILGQVWYLILTIPNICLLPYLY